MVEEGADRQITFTIFGKKLIGLIDLTLRSRIKIGEEVSLHYQDDFV
jgi:hypothetical protein